MPTPTRLIRNFSIIAHIDHGKSTLADRLLDATGALTDRERKAQFLDNMDLERERGITIKARRCASTTRPTTAQTYELNLIDTPGHVDFHYEVSRSLAACEGALLVVDAAQGVEAQTLANVYLALDNNLDDRPGAQQDRPAGRRSRERRGARSRRSIGIDASEAILASAKEGMGIHEILEAIVAKVPPPVGDPDAPLQALILDSWYDTYRGVVILVRVVDGILRAEAEDAASWRRAATTRSRPSARSRRSPREIAELGPGEVGFFTAAIKEVADARVGDTITEAERPCAGRCPASSPSSRWCSPASSRPTRRATRTCATRSTSCALNDSSFTREPETSAALGFGFRCGFLGLLHMEIVQERLEREYNLDLITTAPTVRFRVRAAERRASSSSTTRRKFPSEGEIEHIEEPIIAATIHTPQEYVGAIIKLCQERRGMQTGLDYAGDNRVIIRYDLPLDRGGVRLLRPAQVGLARLRLARLRAQGLPRADLVRLDLLVNGDRVDALSLIVHRERSYNKGRDLCVKMKELIPQQQFEVAIQAAIGSRVIARTTVKALRKNVTAKCYGGDITRKRKLLERQKEGKKRMKQVGNVEIPQEAFLAVLKVD